MKGSYDLKDLRMPKCYQRGVIREKSVCYYSWKRQKDVVEYKPQNKGFPLEERVTEQKERGEIMT